MLTVKLELHDASVELPEESGDYLVFASGNWATRTCFSAKWGKFNTHDLASKPDHAFDVYYWAHFPQELKLAIRGKELLLEDEDF